MVRKSLKNLLFLTSLFLISCNSVPYTSYQSIYLQDYFKRQSAQVNDSSFQNSPYVLEQFGSLINIPNTQYVFDSGVPSYEALAMYEKFMSSLNWVAQDKGLHSIDPILEEIDSKIETDFVITMDEIKAYTDSYYLKE